MQTPIHTPDESATALGAFFCLVWFVILMWWLVGKSHVIAETVTWFRRKAVPAKIFIVCAFCAVLTYGSIKGGGNEPQNQLRPPLLLQVMEPPPEPAIAPVSVWTNGVALRAESTNAVEVTAFRTIGGTELGDWIESATPFFAVGTNPVSRCYVSASGSVSLETMRRPPVGSALPDGTGLPVLCPLRAPLGMVPEANWTNANAQSRFWHDALPGGGRVLTWENALVDRLPGRRVSLQVEMRPDGDCVYRYAFLDELDPPPTNFVMGAQMGTNGVNALSILGTNTLAATVWNVDGAPVTNGVSIADLLCTNGVLRTPATFEIRWKNTTGLDPEADTDDDGLTDGDEVFHLDTDPLMPDTDLDGVPDGAEVAANLHPLVRDSDGDGLVDGSDPAPSNPTAPDDSDGDAIPDAYEEHWFGDMNTVDTADERDDTGFTLAAKLLAGINPTNSPSPPLVVSTNSLVSWRLFDGLAMDWPPAATNLVWERTFAIHRTSAWQQFFVSASPTNAAAWHLDGMLLEWETGGGSSGIATASPRNDSFRIPLPPDDHADTLTLRLRATDTSATLLAPQPLHLIAYAPVIGIGGGQVVVGQSGTTFHVFTNGSSAQIGLAIDHSRRPCHAAPTAAECDLGDFAMSDAIGPAGGSLAIDRPGIYTIPSPSLAVSAPAPSPSPLRTRSHPGGGIPIVVLDPSVRWECNGHGCGYDGLVYDWATGTYGDELNYPLDSSCLRKKWYRDWDGGWFTGNCWLWVNSGLGDDEVGPVSISSDGSSGSVLVGGVVVWTGSAPHAYGEEGCTAVYDEGFLSDECGGCDADCSSGNCDDQEGPRLGSLRFRIPLGIPGKGQVAGFVWLASEGPVSIGRTSFKLLSHPDATVFDTTENGVRRIVCHNARCRDLAIADIANGVCITIRETATQSLEHTWEVTNENGDPARVRLRKISRLNNVMSDETFVYSNGDWTQFDNIAGVSTQLETYGDDSYRWGGTKYEKRKTTDAQGRILAEITTEYGRIGERDNAVLREVYRSERRGDGFPDEWSAAEYWDDPSHSARHGQPRFVWGNARPWVYTDFDDDGREILRVEQRGDAEVPWNIPRFGAGGSSAIFAALPDAFVTVRDYTPLSDDSRHPDDAAIPRIETRLVVRNGVQTTIGLTWTRRIRLVRDGYEAVKTETWRSADAAATSFNAAGNAYSYTIAYTETGAGTPPLMRGAVAESLDEDGIRTVNAYALADGLLTCTTRRFHGESEFPTYEVTERDAVHGTLLLRTTRLSDGGTIVADEQSVYDEKNRLRSTTYLDGTSLTNAYSCCRLLWTRDREGRQVLRSAQTGTDHLHHAMEDVWLADVSTNGSFRVTRHFFDALGRETNTVVHAGTMPGEAVVATAPPSQILSTVSTSYPHPGGDCVVRTDERGAVTRMVRSILNNAEETVETVRTNGVEVLRTVNRTYFGGGSLLRREWGAGNWTEKRRFDDYTSDGRRISCVVTTSSDCGTVTNSVTTYDLLGRLIETRRLGANGSVLTTTTAYDGATNRKVSETTTGSPVVSYEYDALGDLAATIQDGRSVRTATDYAMINGEVYRVVTSARLTGAVTNSVQRRKERLTGLSDALRSRAVTVAASGHETVEETSFDAGTGLLTAVAQSDSATPATSISRFGLPLSQTTLDGRREFAYDAFGRRVVAAMVDTETGVTNRMDSMAYDSSGNVVRRTTDFGMDGLGVWEYSYDILGRETSRTDALGHVQTTVCGPLDRVVATGGDAYPLVFGYDTAGRKTLGATTRDDGETWDGTQWEFDPATGLNTAKEYADGSRVVHAYTDNGCRTRTTWARGAWREHAYNDRNLVIGTTYSGTVTPSVAYTYGDSGKVASATLSDGTAYAYAYDDRLLVTNETATIGQDDYVLERTYDGFRQPLETAVVVTNARHAAKTRFHDSENRIVGYVLTNAAGRGVSVLFAYDGSYLTNSLYTLPNGGHLNVCLTRNPSRKELVTRRETTFGGQPTFWYMAEYDLLGRPTNATDSASLERKWQYNSRSELAAATIGTNAYGYAYDTIGNREYAALNGVTNTYAANALNQYTTIPRPSGPPRSPLYDADGNLVNDRTLTYTYDAENRLVSATPAALTNGALRVLNAYDHRHRRIRKTVQSVTVTIPPAPSPPSETYEWNTVATHTYVWDGDNIVLERIAFADGTTRVCEYFWGLDMSGTEQGAGGVGGLLAVSIDGVFYIPCYDHNGNIVRYVSESGAVAAEYVYDPYGNVVETTGAIAEQFSFGFSAKVHDRETGLVGYQRRFLRPVIGRWLNRDPIEEEGGANMYVFVHNAPVRYWDILGTTHATIEMEVAKRYDGRTERDEDFMIIRATVSDLPSNARVNMVQLMRTHGGTWRIDSAKGYEPYYIESHQYKNYSKNNTNGDLVVEFGDRPAGAINGTVDFFVAIVEVSRTCSTRTLPTFQCFDTVKILATRDWIFNPFSDNEYSFQNISSSRSTQMTPVLKQMLEEKSWTIRYLCGTKITVVE